MAGALFLFAVAGPTLFRSIRPEPVAKGTPDRALEDRFRISEGHPPEDRPPRCEALAASPPSADQSIVAALDRVQRTLKSSADLDAWVVELVALQSKIRTPADRGLLLSLLHEYRWQGTSNQSDLMLAFVCGANDEAPQINAFVAALRRCAIREVRAYLLAARLRPLDLAESPDKLEEFWRAAVIELSREGFVKLTIPSKYHRPVPIHWLSPGCFEGGIGPEYPVQPLYSQLGRVTNAELVRAVASSLDLIFDEGELDEIVRSVDFDSLDVETTIDLVRPLLRKPNSEYEPYVGDLVDAIEDREHRVRVIDALLPYVSDSEAWLDRR